MCEHFSRVLRRIPGRANKISSSADGSKPKKKPTMHCKGLEWSLLNNMPHMEFDTWMPTQTSEVIPASALRSANVSDKMVVIRSQSQLNTHKDNLKPTSSS